MATETVSETPVERTDWKNSDALDPKHSLTELRRAFARDHLEFGQRQLLEAAKWADKSEAPEVHREVLTALDQVTGILESIGARPTTGDTIADDVRMDRQMDVDHADPDRGEV